MGRRIQFIPLVAPDDISQASELPYNNAVSGLTATTTQAAVDELEAQLSAIDAELADKANKTQPAWITPTLLNGWTQLSADVGYMKDTLGFVHFKGAVASGALSSQIFTLPAGYRPQNVSNRFPVVANNKFGRVSVTSTGAVTFDVGENAFVSLDGITFKAV